ncbi:hypothetical protein E2C01_059028 [Portunus trituberculatus]|uniref:Uncharacterized protein n=1 Tax=Portunus trituberculatus TaxID=210409 RepID=A0A5B7H4Q8_PORTR|nr:hypothetical protein [Portunus trituberculatus]
MRPDVKSPHTEYSLTFIRERLQSYGSCTWRPAWLWVGRGSRRVTEGTQGDWNGKGKSEGSPEILYNVETRERVLARAASRLTPLSLAAAVVMGGCVCTASLVPATRSLTQPPLHRA